MSLLPQLQVTEVILHLKLFKILFLKLFYFPSTESERPPANEVLTGYCGSADLNQNGEIFIGPLEFQVSFSSEPDFTGFSL